MSAWMMYSRCWALMARQAADFRRKQLDFFGMVNPQHGRIGVQAAFGFGQLFQKVHTGQRLADAFVFKARFFQHFAQIVGLGEFLEIGKMFQQKGDYFSHVRILETKSHIF